MTAAEKPDREAEKADGEPAHQSPQGPSHMGFDLPGLLILIILTFCAPLGLLVMWTREVTRLDGSVWPPPLKLAYTLVFLGPLVLAIALVALEVQGPHPADAGQGEGIAAWLVSFVLGACVAVTDAVWHRVKRSRTRRLELGLNDYDGEARSS